jgi:hypothetical protein
MILTQQSEIDVMRSAIRGFPLSSSLDLNRRN